MIAESIWAANMSTSSDGAKKTSFDRIVLQKASGLTDLRFRDVKVLSTGCGRHTDV